MQVFFQKWMIAAPLAAVYAAAQGVAMPLPFASRLLPDIALTFDDVLLEPAFSEVLPTTADLSTRFSQNIALNIPFVSAAMDTVTETKMAIAMAQLGGIGVIHRNMAVSQQAEKVRKVKNFQARIVRNMVSVTPETSIAETADLFKRYEITSMPVLEASTKVLAGIVSHSDLQKSTDESQAVAAIMTKEPLVTIKADTDIQDAYKLMQEKQVRRVAIVDKQNRCVGLVTWEDKEKFEAFPQAAMDEHGSLRVAAAVGVGPDHQDRVTALIDAGVDAIVVDSAHGHSKGVLDMVTFIRRQRAGHVDVVAGNIVTVDGAMALIDAGTHAVKVGVGPGAICITRNVTGVGIPQITAVMNAAEACAMQNIPVIADGGVRTSGDAAKALAAGASCVMLGSLVAGTDETPGEMVTIDGKEFKSYRGMGSVGAMNQGSADRYGQSKTKKLVPEGINGFVPARGPVTDVLYQLAGGIRSAMGYTGNPTIQDFRTRTRLVRITNAGFRENHPHSLAIIKEEKN